MNWKFWKKDTKEKESGTTPSKLPRPKDMPQEIGRHLVVVEGCDPDWVWNLRYAIKPQAEGSAVFDFRIFDELDAAKKGVRVANFNSLDEQAELILFEGWMNRKTRQFEIGKTLAQAV